MLTRKLLIPSSFINKPVDLTSTGSMFISLAFSFLAFDGLAGPTKYQAVRSTYLRLISLLLECVSAEDAQLLFVLFEPQLLFQTYLFLFLPLREQFFYFPIGITCRRSEVTRSAELPHNNRSVGTPEPPNRTSSKRRRRRRRLQRVEVE